MSLAEFIKDCAILGIMPGLGDIMAPKPSGDATGVTDRANLNAAIAASVTAGTRYGIRCGSQAYIVDSPVTPVSGSHGIVQPNTVIKMRNKLTPTCTWTTGSKTITVSDTTGLVAGMYISDPAADTTASATFFGAIPWGTKVVSVGTGNVVVNNFPTANGTAQTLNVHPTSNVILATSPVVASLVCPGGWASMDGNWTHSYPYNVSADDSNRNAIRLVNPTDFTMDGIEGINSYYHGCIMVGQISGVRMPRYRGRNNGFRGIHMHGEAITGNTTPQVKNNWYGRIELSGNGHRAIRARNGDENNSGAFVVFDNASNVQIDSLLSIDEYGFGLHMSGGGGSFTGAFVSKHIQVANYIAEGCAISLRIADSIENVHISNFIAHGNNQTLTGCITYASANEIDRYYCQDNGTVASVKTMIVDVPAGSITPTNRPDLAIRKGMRIFMSGGSTGAPGAGLVIWDTSIGTGAGGMDQLIVFNEASPGSNPYTTAATGLAVYVWACKDKGLDLFSAAAPGIRNITFGRITMDNPGQYGISSQYSSSTFRATSLHLGDVQITGATIRGLDFSSVNMGSMSSYHQRNCGSGFITTVTVSGSYDSILQNVCNFDIRSFTAEHDAVFTNNNNRLRVDVDSRNVNIWPVAIKKPASGATLNILTASGAGANAAGVAGPVILQNPTASDGTALTVAGGHITRVDATACIVTRPADAP